MEFLVCMKILASDKTRKCSKVPEPAFFSYCQRRTKFRVCRAGPVCKRERVHTGPEEERPLSNCQVLSRAPADAYVKVSTLLRSTTITITNQRLEALPLL